MKLADFYYDLPQEQIAQSPVSPRDHSRLMVLSRQARTIAHKHFYDLADYLHSGDVLVLNSTRVFPARLKGKKKTGGKVELLLIEALESNAWRSLVRGATQSTDLVFPEGLDARMEERLEEGEWVIRFSRESLREYLDQHGEMPLPPYIKRPKNPPCSPLVQRGVGGDLDKDRYQTVYAEKDGAVAAPTAGFHFTPELLKKIKDKGVEVLFIVLHVGWGTFRPVRVEEVEKHSMLPETYEVLEPVAQKLTAAKSEHRRIIAVGTTAVRTLETVCNADGIFQAGQGKAELFIYPGYEFKAVDSLITNFHLPDSTPLLLANAFYSYQRQIPPDPPLSKGGVRGGVPFSLKTAYNEAIQKGYRFYSYGDAMFIQ